MKKALLKKLYALFLLITICFTTDRVFASHAMASDLTYRCLGGNTYEITLTFYRDCAGIPAPNNPAVSIKSASCSQSFTLTLSAIPGTGQEVSPTCSSTVTTCHGGTFTGIQQWIYKGIVTLPMQCTDWTFSFSLCCRNAAITTINNPGTTMIYLAATLNNTISPGNNSPVFSNMPVPFVCVGQPFCFSEGATDADAGDSIAYQLITPLQSATTDVNYLPGYSAQEPLTSSPPVAFDSTNGEICMTPQQLQVTVMAIVVKNYRNGVLIGSVERDMQIIVMNCNNNLPWLSGINGTNVFNMTVCAGVPFCFNILSNDIDTGQTLTVTANSTIPGATFTSAGNPHPTATFCWTPADSQMSTIPYCFSVTVKDNACPYNGSQVFTYCITVKGIAVNLGPDQQISCTDLASIYSTVSSPDPFTYLWSTGATTSYITTGVGTYWCTVSNGMCSASDTVVVTSPFVPKAAFTNGTPTCLNDTVNFTDQSTSFGSTIVAWNWNFGDGQTSTSQNPSHAYPGSGTYYVQLLVTNSLGCMDSIMDTLTILPPPIAAFTNVNACQGLSVTFTDQSTDSATSWHWNFGDGQTSTSQNPSHTYATSGSYTVILIVYNTIGCPDTISHIVTIYPKPVAGFTAAPACIGSSTAFNNTSTGGITSWHWNFGNGDSSLVQNPNYTYNATGTYNVTLIVTTGNGCIDSITKTVKVNPLPVANAGPDITICSGSPGTLVASGGVTYTWTPGGASGNSIIVNPVINTTYTVTVTDANGCTASDTTSVIVNPLPNANAGPDINICKGSSGTLTASGGVSYSWLPGGYTTASITVNPTVNTTYTVTVTDANGCSATDNAKVFVHQPVVNLAAAFICSGDSTTLDAGVAGVSYSWSTGDTTQIINVNSAGTYSITITDAFGCTATASSVVTVGAPVVVSLVSAAICPGQTTTFNAGNPGSTFLWTPNGETTQSITTGTGGTYGVTVTNASGCHATTSAILTVNPLPIASAGASQTICNGSTATLTASGGTGYQWNPGGSVNQTINVNPASNTSYSVIVTNAFGCAATASVNVVVNPVPVVALSPASICSGASATLDAGNPGSTYLWSPNGEKTQTISVDSTGNYGVTVTNAFGCKDSATTSVNSGSSITVNPLVITICQGQSAVIDAGNPGFSYQWSTGATTQTINVNTSGTYSVTVTNSSGCTGTIVNTVTVNPSPVVQFTSPLNCFGNATVFTDQSTISSGNLTSWNWSFGDGQSSALQNPVHNYATAGTYNVTLIVNGSNACSDTAVQSLTINPLAAANFSSNPVCSGDTSFFNDLSNPNGGIIASWNWTFGDGQTSNAQNPEHNYALAGNYNATLIVSTNAGCVDTISAQVIVNSLPSLNFTAPDVCYGTTTPFNNTSSISNGTIVSYSWNFGDGNSSSSQQPVHQYSTDGSYTVRLTATSSQGCIQSMQSTVNVLPKPAASFVSQNVCQGSAISFTDNSSVKNGSISSWNWNFSDGSASASTSPNHTYSTSGTYNVQLIVIASDGCQDTITNPAIIYSLPAADFSLTNVCQGDQNTFNNLSSISSGNIINYSWAFGDGSTSASANTQHIYNTSGVFNVMLIATSDHGCTDTISHNVNVFPTPIVDFTGTDVCITTSTQFSNQTTLNGGGGFTSSWDFGDSSTSVLINPVHTYTTGGTFNVILTVTSTNGCTVSLTKQVHVNLSPTAAFVTNDNCLGIASIFTDKSVSQNGNITSEEWSFGDGARASGSSVSHTYSASGQYTASLMVTTQYGCRDSVSHPLNVFPVTSPAITAPGVCQGTPVIFLNTGDTFNTSISNSLWTFGDGATSDSLNSTHTYTGSGTFTVTLQTTNLFGCSDTATTTVQVYPNPNPAFNASNECYGIPISFGNNSTISSGNIAYYNWNFGDNFGSSTLPNPTYRYPISGTYTVSLNEISDHGCVANMQEQIDVYPLPVVNFTGVATGCSPFTATFTDLTGIDTGSIAGWLWDFGDGNVSTDQSPHHIYDNPGTYIITLTVSSDKGCVATSTAAEHMVVLPSAKAEFTMTPKTIDIMDPVIHFTNLSSDCNTYEWSFGDGAYSNLFSPSHQYADAGNFTIVLVVNNTYNCPDTAMRRMDVEPVSTLYAPNAFTPNGDGTNDVWQPKYTDLTDLKVWIFDRWGEMIVHWDGLDGYWDGVYKGRPVQQGVYVYQIEGTGVDGKFYKWTGDITLVR